MKYRIEEIEGKFYPQEKMRMDCVSGHPWKWYGMNEEFDTLQEAKDYIKAIPPEPIVKYHTV